MSIHVICAILRIIFQNEERRVVPIRRVRHRIYCAPNRQIVIGNRSLSA